MNDEDMVDIVMNIHQFNQDLTSLNIKYSEEIEKLKQEKERLNNIINELEKWLKDSNNDYIQYDSVFKFDYIVIDDLLNKIQELKEEK